MNHGKVGRYWILTIPHHEFVPYQPPGVQYIKGQLERGEGGFLHWQVMVVFSRNCRLSGVRGCFGPWHAELTKSSRADAYVWKDDTAVANTRFELGQRLVRRNSARDWEQVWVLAQAGTLSEIDAGIRFQHYRTIRQIAADHMQPIGMERRVQVFWGVTGSGKSRRAWEEAGAGAYPKDPRTKFWDGYQGHEHVVIDEFRGDIDIAHLLRWFDRYPVIVEIKGSSVVLRATSIWITSNLDPRRWFPTLDQQTLDALLRRMEITHFPGPLV